MKKKDKIYDSPEYKQIREHLPEILKEMERDKGLKQYQMPEGWNEDFERIYQAEHRKGNDEKIQNGGEEGAVPNGNFRGCVDHAVSTGDGLLENDFPVAEINAAGEHGDQGHDDIIHKRGGNFAERAANDDADGHIHHITAGNKGFELAHKSLCFSRCRHRRNLLFMLRNFQILKVLRRKAFRGQTGMEPFLRLQMIR